MDEWNRRYTHILEKPLEVGNYIIIKGTWSNDSRRFAIDFGCGDPYRAHEGSGQNDIAIHFNPREDEKHIVRNTFQNLTWGTEEKIVDRTFPFQRGLPFHIEVYVDKDKTSWAIGGEHYLTYGHRLPRVFDATYIQIWGLNDALLLIRKVDGDYEYPSRTGITEKDVFRTIPSNRRKSFGMRNPKYHRDEELHIQDEDGNIYSC